MAESVVWIAGVRAVAGLGAALARRFTREDYHVAVSGRSLDKLQTVVADIEANGGKANAIVADLGIEADVLAAIVQVNELGTLRAAIFNVGNSVSKPALEFSAELFEQTWRASTLGGFLFAREATRTLRANGGGSLLFTGATASLRGKPPYTAFAAGKAGLRTVAQSFAREFGPKQCARRPCGHRRRTSESRAPDYLAKLGEDGALKLDDIADAYWYLHTNPAAPGPRSWTCGHSRNRSDPEFFMGTHQTRLAPTYVLGVLNYLQDTGQRPVNYTYPPPDGEARRSGELDPTQVTIHNARLLDEPATINRQGFEKVDHTSAIANLQDDDQVRLHYYPETEALLKQQTLAMKVVIFDHTIRVDDPGREARGLREPVRYVHNDQTERSAIRRVRDHLDPDETEQRLLKRFAIINVWRPIGATVLSTPLALCDARSMADSDLVPSDLVYRDKVGETFSVKANPAHRWYYYPQLRPDEALLLKIHDSRRDVARLSAHTAFDDPTTQKDAPPRRSIELRALVFFDT